MLPIHPGRYLQIITTFFRHGLGWLVARLGLATVVPFHRGLLGHPRRRKPYTAPEHLRLAFEDLGPTFIKLAQILSTRPDLISPPYAEELSRLQDRVSPLPFARVKPVLEAELGRPCEEAFSYFDPEPVSSASIGQVYRAILKNGQKVVVKIQKPGLPELIHKDLDVFRDTAVKIANRTDVGRFYDLNGLLEEFSFNLLNELDYVREGKNCDHFRQLLQGDSRIFIPNIYWELTTARILVMDEVSGIKISALNSSAPAEQFDRRQLAITAMEITFREIFEFGFFHADPHPGNFLIMPDGVLGLIDFGLVGYLDEEKKESFLRFAYSLFRGRTDETLDALWELGVSGSFALRPALKRDLVHFHYRFKERTLSEIAASEMIRDLMTIAYRHHLHFPPDLALLLKVMAMCEGLGAMIDPGFKLFEHAEPYLKKVWQQSFSPANVTRKISSDFFDLLQLAHGLPRRASHLLQRLEAGDIQVELRAPDLKRSTDHIISAIDRLTIAVMMALLLIALGIYILSGHFMGFGYYLVQVLFVVLIIASFFAAKTFLNIRKELKRRG